MSAYTSVRIALFALAAISLSATAPAQSIIAGNTTASLIAARTDTGATPQQDWNAIARNPKVTNLLAFAQQKMGGSITPVPTASFATSVTVRFTRSNVNTDLIERTTIIPLTGNATRLPGASAALIIGQYASAPGLVVPRLLIRENPNNWSPTEYAFRKDGRISEMSARHGDCIFNSSLGIVAQRYGQANASLRNTLAGTAHAGHALVEGLQQVYDVRSVPVGQKELLLTTALMSSANVEEEYDAGYISGTLEQSFKADHRDSFIVAQAKVLAKSLLQDVLKKVGSVIWDALGGLFG